eukprot:snap_masked-scaffold_2-processed-gene-9.38-mRNA-1 protein AED:1.00 eAED:1.00 QI:0/-1/0/0/-1/1/1/0/128
MVLEMDKVKSLGGDARGTQVLQKSKLDFSLLLEDGDRSRLATNFEPSCGKLLCYLDLRVIPGKSDLFAWWRNEEPMLVNVARKFLATETSSIGSERIFSHGRFKYRRKENLRNETFMMRMNVREWMKL